MDSCAPGKSYLYVEMLFLYIAVGRRLLLSFSVFTNSNKVLTVGPSPESNLSAIHGIRFLSMSWVILGHSYAFIMAYISKCKFMMSGIIMLFVCNVMLHCSMHSVIQDNV